MKNGNRAIYFAYQERANATASTPLFFFRKIPSMDKVICLQEKRSLAAWQIDVVQDFTTNINEPHFFRNLLQYDYSFRVPLDSRMWFYTTSIELNTQGFLWASKQPKENGGNIIRVHGLYVYSNVTIKKSKKITARFEKCLNEYAREFGIRQIGFYTKRNPIAFMRRLNVTAPKDWQLDAHVVVRSV